MRALASRRPEIAGAALTAPPTIATAGTPAVTVLFAALFIHLSDTYSPPRAMHPRNVRTQLA